jgi:phosphohistidine phosphatase
VTDRRLLIVMRHAKAEPFAATDHERRLTERGVADARTAGEFLTGQGACPDRALVSPSVRTRMTWDEVVGVCGATQEPDFDDGLYLGGPDTVLERVQATPDEDRTVLFIGHNPTASYLCHLLDDGEGDPDVVGEMLRGFPTAATAVFEVPDAWSGLGPESARLVAFHGGRS